MDFIKQKNLLEKGGLIVTPIGFEPMAHSLEGCCSIQLSYGAKFCKLKIWNANLILFFQYKRSFFNTLIITLFCYF